MKGNKGSCLFSKPPAHSTASSTASQKHSGHQQHSGALVKANASLKCIVPFREVKQMHYITSTTFNSHSNSLSSWAGCLKSLLKVHICRFWRTHWGKDDLCIFDPKRSNFPLARRRTLRPFSSKRLTQSSKLLFCLLPLSAIFCILWILNLCLMTKTAAKYSRTLWKHSTTYKATIFFSSFAVYGSVVGFLPEHCIVILQHSRSQ